MSFKFEPATPEELKARGGRPAEKAAPQPAPVAPVATEQKPARKAKESKK